MINSTNRLVLLRRAISLVAMGSVGRAQIDRESSESNVDFRFAPGYYFTGDGGPSCEHLYASGFACTIG